MRKILIVIIILFVPIMAGAYDVEIEGIYYNLTSKVKMAEVVPVEGLRYSGSISIPETISYNGETYTVMKIADYAFYYCQELHEISIPSTIQYVGYQAFDNCSTLDSVFISDLAAWCQIEFDGVAANPMNRANHLFLNDEEIIHLRIPEGVKMIKANAFILCTNILSVDFPSSLCSIGNRAFQSCYGLESLTIPENVESIGENAFYYCI